VTIFFVERGEIVLDASGEITGVAAPWDNVLKDDVAMGDEDVTAGEIERVMSRDIGPSAAGANWGGCRTCRR
jgi:hypothetical protein